MAEIGFSYLPRPVLNPQTNKLQEVFTPFIQIRLSIHHNNPSPHFDALVDSGADRNLFPLQLGELLEISFKKIKPRFISGIGNIELKAYPAKINIWINNIKYSSEADFSREQKTILLGREGFFSLFKSIRFDEKGKFLYIEFDK